MSLKHLRRKLQTLLFPLVPLSLACLASHSVIAQGSWTARSGDWHDPDNWQDIFEFDSSGNLRYHDGIPRADDNVFLRQEGSNQIGLSADVRVADINMTKQNRVQTNGHTLRAADVALENSASLQVNRAVSGMPGDVQADRIVISGGTVRMMDQAARVRVAQDLRLAPTTQLNGKGLVSVGPAFGPGLVNDGSIVVSPFGAFGGGDGTLTLMGLGSTTLDLDGNSENGELVVRQQSSDSLNRLNLVVDGALSDPYSGTLIIGANDSVEFVREGFIDGTLNLKGRGGPATLRGAVGVVGDGFVRSNVNIEGEGVLDIANIGSNVRFNFADDSTLHLRGEGSVRGSTGFAWNRNNTTLKVSGNYDFHRDTASWMNSGLDHLVVEGGNLRVRMSPFTGNHAEFNGDISISDGSVDMSLFWNDSWSSKEPLTMSNGLLEGADYLTTSSLIGSGVVDTKSFGNVGTVEAVGGTLEFKSNVSLDGKNVWEGLTFVVDPPVLSEDGQGLVLAEQGSILVSGEFDHPSFHGKMRVANGNSFRASTNDLVVRRDAEISLLEGTLEAKDITLLGKLATFGDSTIEAETFEFKAQSSATSDGTLTVKANSTIHREAEFSGPGALVNGVGQRMTVETDRVELGVWNDGELLVQQADTTLSESERRIGRVMLNGFRQRDTGRLYFDWNAAIDESDSLLVSNLFGSADLNGTVQIMEVSGTQPNPYDQELIVTAPSLTGKFSSVEGATTDSAYGYAVTYDDESALVTYALAGDTNLDGKVDFPDFLKLAQEFGNTGTWVDGDFDGDGTIQFLDFLALSRNFGVEATSASAAAVPEPSGFVLCLLGLLGLRRK